VVKVARAKQAWLHPLLQWPKMLFLQIAMWTLPIFTSFLRLKYTMPKHLPVV
jgi:hypothetical protein